MCSARVGRACLCEAIYQKRFLPEACQPVYIGAIQLGGEGFHLGRDDQQHGCDSSKCCWSPELHRQKDQDDGEFQGAGIQERPKGHSVIEPTNVVRHQVDNLRATIQDAGPLWVSSLLRAASLLVSSVTYSGRCAGDTIENYERGPGRGFDTLVLYCQGITFPALMSAMELLFSRRALAKMAEMACWRIAKPMRMPCLSINAPRTETCHKHSVAGLAVAKQGLARWMVSRYPWI